MPFKAQKASEILKASQGARKKYFEVKYVLFIYSYLSACLRSPSLPQRSELLHFNKKVEGIECFFDVILFRLKLNIRRCFSALSMKIIKLNPSAIPSAFLLTQKYVNLQ